MQSLPLIFVLYDGIANSVFEGQVVQPLLERKKRRPEVSMYLVSYEIKKPCSKFIARLSSLGITCIILPKNRWWLSSKELHTFLSQFSAYELIARGPLAGYLCLQARKEKCCIQLTVQARGLLAEEYRYAHENEKSILKHVLYTLRAIYFNYLEHRVYYKATHTAGCMVEAVSPALQQYLIDTFSADKTAITIAYHDIPITLCPAQIAIWKAEIRTHLNIPDFAFVYCYNGSIKPWQCPELALSFFKEQLQKNRSCVLLVLTQDVAAFSHLVSTYTIPILNYRILHVPHALIYHYLAAADSGLLFRKPHIVNWTSRPTKLLEYAAVGLDIIHNDTVAYVSEVKSTRSHLS